MNYTTVSYLSYQPSTNIHYIRIDNTTYRFIPYTSWCSLDNGLYYNNGTNFRATLDCYLELNINNPKETIDTFFKLLLLQ
jgi:hypothetical protein